MQQDIVLLLCAAHSLALAVFHVAFWRLFRWPESLRTTTLPNRAILQIVNVQLIWLFLCVAALCLWFPGQLRGTALGNAVLAGMSGFWVLRLAQQFVLLRVRHPLVRILSAVFALGAVLFAWPLLAER